MAHGSGSSRLSPRNMAVASALNDRGITTLLFDLLTPGEEGDRANVFDIPLLVEWRVDAVRWLDGRPFVGQLPLRLFGASTGAAGAGALKRIQDAADCARCDPFVPRTWRARSRDRLCGKLVCTLSGAEPDSTETGATSR